MEKDIETIIKNSTIQQIEDFWSGVENEGLTYYLQNFDTPFDDNDIFIAYTKKPFFEALEFFQSLVGACENFFYELENNV